MYKTFSLYLCPSPSSFHRCSFALIPLSACVSPSLSPSSSVSPSASPPPSFLELFSETFSLNSEGPPCENKCRLVCWRNSLLLLRGWQMAWRGKRRGNLCVCLCSCASVQPFEHSPHLAKQTEQYFHHKPILSRHKRLHNQWLQKWYASALVDYISHSLES